MINAAYVKTVSAGVYQARCTCGWEGRVTGKLYLAEHEADEHADKPCSCRP